MNIFATSPYPAESAIVPTSVEVLKILNNNS